MRVCLISREYPPDTGYGGIATFTRHLAHGLRELGNDVEVISLAEGAAKLQDDDGIPVHRVTPFVVPGDLGAVAFCMPYSRYVLKAAPALWQKFLELHEHQPFDVIDTPELLAEGIFPAVTKAAPLVIRLYTPHSKFIAEQLHIQSANFDHQFIAMLERVAMTKADALTSPSDDLAEFVSSDLAYDRSKIKIIRNPIDPNVFSPEGPTALPEPEGQRVLFVGRLEERKGINYLVQAIPQILEQCPQTEFVIIGADTEYTGSGGRSMLADLRDYLTRMKALSHVKFIARVPLDKLPEYYRSADVCVVPSVYDNSPYTCLEAMSCGRPVVGTSGGGTKEYVSDGECGLIVPPKDPQALKNAIVTLLKDGRTRTQMGQNARNRVLDKFQRKQIASETLELYQQAKLTFASKQKLYLRDADQALSDAAVMLFGFDKMIYDMLYQQSWRFRLRHWWRLGAARPRLLAMKMLLHIARAASAPLSKKAHPPAFVQWLEKQISQKQEDPFQRLLALEPNRPSS